MLHIQSPAQGGPATPVSGPAYLVGSLQVGIALVLHKGWQGYEERKGDPPPFVVFHLDERNKHEFSRAFELSPMRLIYKMR